MARGPTLRCLLAETLCAMRFTADVAPLRGALELNTSRRLESTRGEFPAILEEAAAFSCERRIRSLTVRGWLLRRRETLTVRFQRFVRLARAMTSHPKTSEMPQIALMKKDRYVYDAS
mmetsp:Transcript_55245/g.85909  ORF Transcript_55245/g.85909 Transcript_55245/m.85909 type:complete len:118 (+) Transcript_55245:909-1262(+)